MEAGADSYVLLKFYEMSHGLVLSLLDNRAGDAEYEFRMSEHEHAVCQLKPSPPESILLIGRSGWGAGGQSFILMHNVILHILHFVLDPCFVSQEARHPMMTR